MKSLRLLLVPMLLIGMAFTLPDCSGRVKQLFETAAEVSISKEQIIAAAYTFNALEAGATNYIRLRRCTGSNGPICRNQEIANRIIVAVRTGRAARNSLTNYLRKNPEGGVGIGAVYNTLVDANSTLRTLTTVGG